MELDFPYGAKWVIRVTDKELRQIRKGRYQMNDLICVFIIGVAVGIVIASILMMVFV